MLKVTKNDIDFKHSNKMRVSIDISDEYNILMTEFIFFIKKYYNL